MLFMRWDDGPGGDLLAVVLKQENEEWKLQYRFRYYAVESDGTHKDGGDPFIEADTKHWYETRGPRSDLIRTLELMRGLPKKNGLLNITEDDLLTVNGTGSDCIEMMRKRPWASVKTEGQVADPS
jgi:hypothetical protein